jgi:hypothetical protein
VDRGRLSKGWSFGEAQETERAAGCLAG